ncbi:PREDICTED: FERM domain-containing protein 7-like, partial [Priapulus caudatus]|uniref:FERM domain-containing protein 7-like n=1 Tax=Priapulus caudatus TaxID=37621 RepID=A0ABM1F575_PRICU
MSPAEADLMLLDIARKVELYGIRMHTAKDHESVGLNVAVAHYGIIVFQNLTKINTFSWAKIRKISFKRKRFLIKLHPESQLYYKDTVDFYFDDRTRCKIFWKKCVEHHAFFRCATMDKVERRKKHFLSKGSSFRYSGRTLKEMVDHVRQAYVKRQTLKRF